MLPHRRLRVRDGQIEVGGQTLFAGYLTADGIEPPPLSADGWFDTGDCGRLDAAGVLTVTGRADAMFVSGGENIHPQEIEAVLGEHPRVAVAVVVPAPDPDFGARPVAFIEPHASPAAAMPAEAELQALLAARLPRFKHPARYYTMPEATASGICKPDRAHLIALARVRADGT